ncbi:MAG: hypothetical protein HY791_17780 [Deltaproteobacteria bacterium]|nr:hypothetical protein [Deltaproteobacteria bacterium]
MANLIYVSILIATLVIPARIAGEESGAGRHAKLVRQIGVSVILYLLALRFVLPRVA